MSDNSSTPVTTEKKTYPSDPVPADYAPWSNKDKLQWLDSQGFAHDPTINLGDCYRSGAKVTQICTLITKLLQRMYTSLGGKASQTIRKAFSTFLNAYNQSIGRLSNEIYSDAASLLSTGRFNNGSNLIEPVSIPDLPIENDDGTSNILTTVHGFKDKIWPYFLNVLQLLQDKWKWLSKVHPGMNVSYNNLIKAMTDAGETLFLEYQKEQDRSAGI
ncbi:hypothetical protein NCS57_00928500 [Fusarium keratoplasticum]|uniref:Uncharacterized protein n=1 Tax=Fusarium keratoplasticum TaxID=1328300 RepID=A0ACC0QRH5_9HYPO|nr:hypothetical protein NCS57_00928500 [Fusarium keratoplasticum]KAI8663279.1 hypothetical protein NCS57_00928500 [Fusarium keratoplasticum]